MLLLAPLFGKMSQEFNFVGGHSEEEFPSPIRSHNQVLPVAKRTSFLDGQFGPFASAGNEGGARTTLPEDPSARACDHDSEDKIEGTAVSKILRRRR